jgi:hypothetical protein
MRIDLPQALLCEIKPLREDLPLQALRQLISLE